MDNLDELLAQHPFFQGWEPAYRQRLRDCAMPARFAAGELIFRAGEIANRYYLLVQGRVAIEAARAGGPPVEIQELGGGEVLGWSWLFPPYCWHFGARALEPTTAVFLYGTRLREFCEEDKDFGYELMKRLSQVLVGRLQASERKLLELRKPRA
jgi:CRP-like cAMP-binding protein